jgi:hypothetical protein
MSYQQAFNLASIVGLRSGPETHGILEMKPTRGVMSMQGRWKEHEEEEGQKRVTGGRELMQQQPNYPGAALVSGFMAQGKFYSSDSLLRFICFNI